MMEFSTGNWVVLITILGIMYSLCLMTKSTQVLIRGDKSQIYGFCLMIFLIFYVGTRPLWCYTDSALYSRIYQLVQTGAWSSLAQNPSEWFFTMVETICLQFTDAHGWFFVVALFYIGGMCFAAWKWLPKHFTMAVMFMFTAFSFWSYSNNGIRQGMGASLVLAGLACLSTGYHKDRLVFVLGAVLSVLGCSCHNSLWLVAIAAVVALFYHNYKVAFYFWAVCLILSPFSSDVAISIATHLIEDERMSAYGTDDSVMHLFSRVGWRWDFILYSAVPVLLAYYAVVKCKIRERQYIMLLNVYLYTNAAWMLVNAIPYSNRFAYISWSMYPMMLCMPLAKFKLFKRQGIVAGLILFGDVIFNLIF